MIMRTAFAIICSALLYGCTQNATGQKDGADLTSRNDSISYGLGADIGRTLKEAGMDSLSVQAMAAGIQDALDSQSRMDDEKIRSMVQAYQIQVQQRMMEKEQKAGEENLRKGEAFLAENGRKTGVVTTASGLQYEILKAGTGPKPTMESTVMVNYRGTLIDGTEFDSGTGSTFQLGNVIQGFSEALQLMPAGSRWKLFVPAGLAYGPSRGPGGQLPPYSTLIFELELVEVR